MQRNWIARGFFHVALYGALIVSAGLGVYFAVSGTSDGKTADREHAALGRARSEGSGLTQVRAMVTGTGVAVSCTFY